MNRVTFGATVMIVLALVVSCAPAATPTPQVITKVETKVVEVVKEVTPAPKPLKLPLVFYCEVKDISAEFWQGAVLGCKQAGEELGPDKVTIKYTTGTSDLSIEDSIKAFEDALAAGADGIVLAPADSVALIPAVQKANKMGVPVVAMDTAVNPPAKLLGTVATDKFTVMLDAAVAMIKAAGGKGKFAATACTVTIDPCRQGTAAYLGALEQFPDAQNVGMPLVCPSREKAYNAIKDILIAHPDLAGVLGFAGPDGLGAAQAVKDMGSKALVITGSCSMEELEAVRDGLTYACFAQFPRLMGYKSIMELWDYYQGKDVPPYTNSGSDIVTKDKAQSYIALGPWMGPPK